MNRVKRSMGMARAVTVAALRALLGPQGTKEEQRERLLRTLRPIPFALAIAAIVAWQRGRDVNVAAPSPAAALVEVLASRGLTCSAEDVVWVKGAAGTWGAVVGGARALVRAHAKGEPYDQYLVSARLSPEGEVLSVGSAWNLTRSSGVDESRAVVAPPGRGGAGVVVAFTASADGLVTSVHTVDLGGRPPEAFAEFSRTQRLQTAITNLQRTGQSSGIVHHAFALDPVARQADLAWEDDGTLTVRADDRRIAIDAAAGRIVDGAAFARAVPDALAKPGNVPTWLAERAREGVGDEETMWLKAVVFTGLDWAKVVFAKETTAKELEEELGVLNSGQVAPTFTDPELGWPPAPIEPRLKPPIPGEGKWIALDKDPFIAPSPLAELAQAPPPFVTTFVRPNAHRPDLRVFITLWDPRQIALHMESGTVEPVSATGERGPGLIPRTPEVMQRVVAAFNGGFQAQHGEYGMQANGIVYLPPKPYAATVMELRDGSTAFGVWPPPPPGTPVTVPPEVLSLRQNLTPLVQFDQVNPWKRTWWGGTPPGWGDTIHTARSALCITKERFVGYFYSPSISADDLATALLAARCALGMHLDMNPGHAGFEFYNIKPASEWTSLGRPLQNDWEAEGKVRGMPDWNFRARRMIRGMGHMNFPRYIQREGRDFFYLTTRPILPGPRIPSPEGGAQDPELGAWHVRGLPQHGFPYAVAIAQLKPDAKRPDLTIRAARIDPRTVRPAGGPGTTPDSPTIVSFTGAARASHGESTLFHDGVGFAIAQTVPDEAYALAIGVPPGHPSAASARAAAGIQDEDGMLTWLELPPEVTADASTAAAMDAVLERAGCSTRLLVPGQVHALLGGSLDVTGAPATFPTAPATRLVRGRAPGAEMMFEDTPLVPPTVWHPLQAQRVRYVHKSAPAPTPSSTSTGASSQTAKGPALPIGPRPGSLHP